MVWFVFTSRDNNNFPDINQHKKVFHLRPFLLSTFRMSSCHVCSSVSSCSTQSQPLSVPSLFHFPSLLLPDTESCMCGACIHLFDSVCGCFLSLFFIVFVRQRTAVINYEISNGFPIHSEHTQRQCVPSSVCVSVQTESVQRNRRGMNSLVRSDCACA